MREHDPTQGPKVQTGGLIADADVAQMKEIRTADRGQQPDGGQTSS